MWFGLDENLSVIDKDLHEKANSLGIVYVSPFNVFCNAEGCMTRVGDKPEDLLTLMDFISHPPLHASS